MATDSSCLDCVGNAIPVAICGMGMRLPGGIRDANALYELLINKRDARSPTGCSRYDVDKFYDPAGRPHTMWTKHGYWLHDIDLANFDTSMFKMTAAEVERLDPQQRLLLEVVWEAMQNAGEYRWKGKEIGCYVAGFLEDWLQLSRSDPQDLNKYEINGSMDLALANRISYEYDLKGPSMTVKVGCSGSGVCLHLACQAIAQGDCTSAIVAGTSIIMSPRLQQSANIVKIFSAEGSCKSFDATADGYVRAEGVNAIFVKRLDAALRDGNPIRAVIRATSSNSDGNTLGFVQPSEGAQESVIRKAYYKAGIVNMSETAMVECHGTGTATGDPIEATAIGRVFGEKGIYIGSVKPNLGHAEGASAINSMIKAVLSLESGLIFPNIKLENPNPAIPKSLTIPLQITPWPEGARRRISVNSFGIGGSNFHAILDSAESCGVALAGSKISATLEDRRFHKLLTFSAAHPDSLDRVINSHKEYIKEHPSRLASLELTLLNHREHLPYRAYCVTSGTEPMFSSIKSKCRPSYQLCFVFNGQGSQCAQMGKELIEQYPSFCNDIKRMEEFLGQLEDGPPWALKAELLKPRETSNIDIGSYAQPLNTALQVALVNLLATWNVTLSNVVGHSSGEIAAAYAAGVLDMQEAIIVSYYRGRVFQDQSRRGAMAAVALGRDEIASYIKPGVVIACENSPSSVTLSGDRGVLEDISTALHTKRPDVLIRKLNVDTAYHSHHMREGGETYYQSITPNVKPKQPNIPFWSTVTGAALPMGKPVSPKYWQTNLENPVLFSSAILSIFVNNSESHILLEVGAHSTLSAPLKQIIESFSLENKCAYVPTLRRGQNSAECYLMAMGQLFTHGVGVQCAKYSSKARVLTDLPPYPWRYERRFWYESRVMRSARMPQSPFHDILGQRILEGNELFPTWRVMLELGNVPWLRGHCVHREVVFPAAAYISMAGEAVRQLTGKNDYTLRDVVFHTAMVLHDTGSTEIMTVLESQRLTNTLDSPWYRFTISSYDGPTCRKHCTGLAGGGRTSTYPEPAPRSLPRRVQEDRFYKSLAKLGLRYENRFRKITKISTGIVEPTADAFVIDNQQTDESQYPIHPTTLDVILQSLILAAHKGDMGSTNQIDLPTSIEEIYVGNGAGKLIQISSHVYEHPLEGFKGISNAYALGGLVFSVKGYGTRPLDTPREQLKDYNVAYLQWSPEVNFQSPESLIKTDQFSPRYQVLAETLFLLCALDTQQDIENATPVQPYLCKYRDWILRYLEKAASSGSPLVENSAALFRLESDDRKEMIKAISDEIDFTDRGLILRVYKSLAGLVDGSVDPLPILLQDNGLENIYTRENQVWDYRPFFSSLGHVKPQMKILEVGGGTASLSENILQYLQSDLGEPLYRLYTFTDVSKGFLSRATQKLRRYPNVEYRLVDISKDPEQQGLDKGSYDLVIASNVLHVTPNLHQTLTYIRTLLRPDGRLFMQEICASSKVYNFLMGSLPDWWAGENDGRLEEPYIAPEEWRRRLSKAGLSRIDAMINDKDHPYRINATIIARPDRQRMSPGCVALLSKKSVSQVARGVGNTLLKLGFQVQHILWKEAIPPLHDIISFIELEEPFFDQIDEADMQSFLTFIKSLGDARVLWLMKSAQLHVCDPRFALALGMARTIRTELGITFATLELDDVTTHSSLKAIADVFDKIQERCDPIGDTGSDMEYAYTQGSVHVGRYHWVPLLKELERPAPAGARELIVGKPGLLQSLEWAPRTFCGLWAQGVQIKVHAAGLNFKDVLLASGIINLTTRTAILGLDASGVVTAVGSNVNNVKVGDRVMALASCMSTMASEFQASSTHCIRIPDSLGFAEAATMPCVYITVLRALLDKAQLHRGQSLLIHSASGGVGIAAIMVARWIGADIYASAGTDEKREFLTHRFGIPVSHLFSSRDDKFVDQLMAVTSGRGVDVVLNSLSGDLLHASWKCVASGGCMVELGKRDILGNGDLAMSVFGDNRSFIGVDLGLLAINDHPTIQRLFKELIRLYKSGDIEPIAPVSTFSAIQPREAFQCLRRSQHIGKVVLTMAESDQLQLAPLVPTLSFRNNASYLLIGGLGGLGRSIATWMASHGAGNLVFLSRSAGKSEDDRLFSLELQALGCSVQMFNGDVSKTEDVEQTVCNTSTPIAGIIHMAMVLSDAAVLEMTLDKWRATVDSKVQGAWNLHNALHGDLDFFVLFASLSGIAGYYGQCNYAAANTFLDSFVQFRHGLGLPASVIDFGAVEDVGFISQHPEILRRLEKFFTKPISEQEMLGTLQLAMERSRPKHSNSRYYNMSQIAAGLVPLAGSSLAQDPRWAHHFNLRRDDRMDKGQETKLDRFLADTKADPTILDEQNSINVVAKGIKEQVQRIMMIEQRDGSADMTLSEMGLDSLVGAELQNWWRTTFGVEVALLVLINANTFQKLGELAIQQLRESTQGPAMAVEGESQMESGSQEDFANYKARIPRPQEKDVDGSPDILSLNNYFDMFHNDAGSMSFDDKQIKDDRHVIILTGSTGSLGCYLLFELLQMTSIARIYCLCRSNDAAGRQKRNFGLRGLDIPDDFEDRVEFLCIDLPAPNLGIADEKYDELRLSVNSIIHCAWDLNFVKPLDAFERVHIQGLARLLELGRCCRYRVHVHFMSSVVAVGHNRTSLPAAEVLSETRDFVLPHAYAESKYAAERMCKLASENWGLPSTVYRMGQIAGSSGGEGIWNEKEWFPSMIQASKILHKVPSSIGSYVIDWLPVDQVAKVICEIFESRTGSATSPAVFHLVNPHRASWESLLPAVQEKYLAEVVDIDCWFDDLQKFASSRENAEGLPGLNMLLMYRHLLHQSDQGQTPPSYDTQQSEKLSATLRKVGPITLEMMARWVQQWNF